MAAQHDVGEINSAQALPSWAYKAILEQLHEGVIISTIDGRFRRLNLKAAQLYGYKQPEDFERNLPKLSTIFELRSFPKRKIIPYREWPMTRLRNGVRSVDEMLYVKRRDIKHELLLHYNGKLIKSPEGNNVFALLSLADITDQEQNRRTMQLNNERLKLAQKAGKIGTFEWQIPANKLLWSEEMEELYGVEPGTFSSNPDDWRRKLHPEDLQRVERLIQHTHANRQRSLETEWRIILPDQSVRNILAKAEVTYDAEGRPFRMIGINMDITERRKAAEAYRASIDRQSAFFKTALDAIVTIDQKGIIIEFNPAAERIFGYKRSEAIDRNMAELMMPERYRDEHNDGLAQYLKTGRGKILDKQVEVTARRKNGQEFPAELFITRIGNEEPPVFMGTLRDITGRKRAEQELRASEERFRFMAESVPQKIFTTLPDGQINYLNPLWADYLGKSIREILEAGGTSFVHPDEATEVRKKWRHSIATGETLQVEQRIRSREGEYRWHLTVARPMRDDDGNIIKWIGSSTDIEDVKQRQELEERTTLLTEQREQLMMINHAKDEFISLASHQLRTPATGVKQYVGMLMQGYFGELQEDQLAILRSAYESNERQLGIINALLNVARLDAGKVTLEAIPCDMSAMLESITEEQAEVFRIRHQNLMLHLPKQPALCQVDTQLIRMVLENIIDNAGKYSPDGKSVDVVLRQTKANTIIEVRDQGVGMRKQDQEKLFQKFSRIDNELSSAASGSGLGLYWAKKIMDLHGGKITVESKAHHGSTFTITIPRVLPQQPSEANTAV